MPYGQIRLVFTEGADLTPLEKTRPVDSGDFTQMAPEVSWTRLLTPEAGVYSMGLVMRYVLGDVSEITPQDPNASLLPQVMALINKCLHARPSERPSMNGIFLELDKATSNVHHTKQQRWTPV
ncbi:Protein kinase domain-containing protein [Trichostrongylus colubriformis]|uniref:Protein kinase domain-containing protein n=1 Tax=Trichostrongylus colubriformis TaxID=6319 RepID=A0AAN8FWE4_TRICO